MPKKNSQLDQPATKGDVENAVDELAQITDKNFRRVDDHLDKIDGRLDAIGGRLDNHDSRFDRIERVLKAVLAVVKSIDRDNKEFKQHNLPERVTKVEDDVLKLKTRVR